MVATESSSSPNNSDGSNNANGTTPRDLALSKVSKMYDIDGDGELNETEQAMRDLDDTGLGHISNEKVYHIMEQQLALQKQMFNMKRIVIGLVAFSVILALSNLGTAFAAASLAKDTTVSEPETASARNPTLQDKTTGQDLATVSKGLEINVESITIPIDTTPSATGASDRRMLRSSRALWFSLQALCEQGKTYEAPLGCYSNQGRPETWPCRLNQATSSCATGLVCSSTAKYKNIGLGQCIKTNPTPVDIPKAGDADADADADDADADVDAVETDSVVIALLPLDKGQSTWAACSSSTSTTIEHSCSPGSTTLTHIDCTDASKQDSEAGPIYFFGNDVVIDCSVGAEMCSATGLVCPVAHPGCQSPPTQHNANEGLLPNQWNICSGSCQCLSGCCLRSPTTGWVSIDVCAPPEADWVDETQCKGLGA